MYVDNADVADSLCSKLAAARRQRPEERKAKKAP